MGYSSKAFIVCNHVKDETNISYVVRSLNLACSLN